MFNVSVNEFPKHFTIGNGNQMDTNVLAQMRPLVDIALNATDVYKVHRCGRKQRGSRYC